MLRWQNGNTYQPKIIIDAEVSFHPLGLSQQRDEVGDIESRRLKGYSCKSQDPDVWQEGIGQLVLVHRRQKVRQRMEKQQSTAVIRQKNHWGDADNREQNREKQAPSASVLSLFLCSLLAESNREPAAKGGNVICRFPSSAPQSPVWMGGVGLRNNELVTYTAHPPFWLLSSHIYLSTHSWPSIQQPYNAIFHMTLNKEALICSPVRGDTEFLQSLHPLVLLSLLFSFYFSPLFGSNLLPTHPFPCLYYIESFTFSFSFLVVTPTMICVFF